MAIINRDDPNDASRIIGKFIFDNNARKKFIDFLNGAIVLADNIDNTNWNLNLDKNGQFLRFNTGQEFCIELNKAGLLILCDKASIRDVILENKIPVIYRGYIKGIGDVISNNFENTPDLLVKVKNSIGCILKPEHIEENIDYFEQSNKEFILSAMKTRITESMRKAHSRGALKYVMSECTIENRGVEIKYEEFISRELSRVTNAKSLSQKERLKILKQSNIKPQKVVVQQVVFQRNPFVIAEALFRANGVCERCKKYAPFNRDIDSTPYLEVHHIKRLADGGDDTLENVIALCPNCHRHAHYGKASY